MLKDNPTGNHMAAGNATGSVPYKTYAAAAKEGEQGRPQPRPPLPPPPPLLPNSANTHGKATTVEGADGQKMTVIHRGSSLTKDIVEQVLLGKQPQSSLYNAPPMMTHQSSNVAPRYLVGKQNQTASRSMRGGLRGVKSEKGTPIYVKNIAVDGESDYEIASVVQDHCKEIGLRVMSHRIIKYRGVYDVVGCRIVVPQSQEYMALDYKNWPDEVEVRRWESPDVWYRKQENDNYFGSSKGGYRGEDEPQYDNRWNRDRHS